MRNITTQIKTGGEHFHLNPREHKLLLCLIAQSPHIVPIDEIRKSTKASQAYVRKMITEIRPIVELEGGIIETVHRRGYRILKVGKFQ